MSMHSFWCCSFKQNSTWGREVQEKWKKNDFLKLLASGHVTISCKIKKSQTQVFSFYSTSIFSTLLKIQRITLFLTFILLLPFSHQQGRKLIYQAPITSPTLIFVHTFLLQGHGLRNQMSIYSWGNEASDKFICLWWLVSWTNK